MFPWGHAARHPCKPTLENTGAEPDQPNPEKAGCAHSTTKNSGPTRQPLGDLCAPSLTNPARLEHQV